jgi:iron complex transport system substrate-binding protein
MRIASLVPSATEMLFALGLGDSVVAVTHECDFPPEAAGKPVITRSVIPEGLSAGEIDARVRELTGAGQALYEFEEEALRELELDLIVTQGLCAVCAVSYEDVQTVAERLPGSPEVISLDPETLDDVLDDCVRLAAACGVRERGEQLRAGLRRRLDSVRSEARGQRPRVLALEWLDPPFIGGHWVPEMIEIAGGESLISHPGERSRTAEWKELADARPDVVIAMPCGWDAEQAHREALQHEEQLATLGAKRIFCVDAAASFSRPGPRLVDGTELVARLLADYPATASAPPKTIAPSAIIPVSSSTAAPVGR